ncbi:MAG: nicotinate-nucleotide adenylyltransferase [Gammaproteobacteria bacterium]
MIGVYGGTFDPVHYGHLRTALEVKEALGLSEMRLIPCFIPPHRGEPSAAAESRLEMLKLSVQGLEGFTVDARELERGGPSYMVDTLKSLKDDFGPSSLFLIVGSDAFSKLTSWHRWRNLFDFAHVVVMSRPGARHAADGLDSFFRERWAESLSGLKEKQCGRLYFQEVTQLAISATGIRRMLKNGRSPRFLLPDAVLEHIARERLYGGQ